jgi:hypothetical protein
MNEAKMNKQEPEKTVCDKHDNSLIFSMEDNLDEKSIRELLELLREEKIYWS